jgi:hypothetical protein
MAEIICKKCSRRLEHHAKGLCMSCYKKHAWQPKLVKCQRCQRELPMQAKGYCKGCYTFLFQLDKVKASNYRKWHNIDIETYKKLTQKCVICNFDKVVDLHHLDEDKKNNSEENLIGLCPNHHKMLHNSKFKAEILEILKEKGYKI